MRGARRTSASRSERPAAAIARGAAGASVSRDEENRCAVCSSSLRLAKLYHTTPPTQAVPVFFRWACRREEDTTKHVIGSTMHAHTPSPWPLAQGAQDHAHGTKRRATPEPRTTHAGHPGPPLHWISTQARIPAPLPPPWTAEALLSPDEGLLRQVPDAPHKRPTLPSSCFALGRPTQQRAPRQGVAAMSTPARKVRRPQGRSSCCPAARASLPVAARLLHGAAFWCSLAAPRSASCATSSACSRTPRRA